MTKRPVVPQRVVGIGASAGGLDALKQLVAGIPADTGLAFVVLQHLPPSQVGRLASLLGSASRVPVVDAATGHRIEPNTIVVVPPRTAAGLYRGALVLRAPKGGSRPRLPIDSLFRSLADVLGERAVGVVLSGTARDGTEGLRAIRAAGGLTFVQDPSTAQFDEMPRNAIAAGVAEVVAAPDQIAEELEAIAKLGGRPHDAGPVGPAIDRILAQLRSASGVDFASYKRSTIERRLARQLAKGRHASLDELGAYLEAHPEEATAVYEDLLIHVTGFFRDAPILDQLAARVFPELIGASSGAPIRVWVPGCSTGEEVYSLAMLLLEAIGERGRPIQLFGSDLSERAIETARQGRYPDAIAAQVGADRLARFFQREDGGYRIHRDVRERCVFVRHDLLGDPPFSRLDLVSCRNVLIYLGAPLQERAIPIFHYALRQPGYLLLGRAETLGGFEGLFETIDGDARIYARKPSASGSLTFDLASHLARQATHRAGGSARSAVDAQREVDHLLLARYAPACVLVDGNLDILQFRGRTGPYLEQPPGQPQVNLMRLARGELAADLSLAFQRARRGTVAVRREDIAVREHGREHRLHLEVVPLGGGQDVDRRFLVVFEPVAAVAPRRGHRGAAPARARGELLRVTHELEATRGYLSSVVAQHLATTEELGIANEELQSANEELQSTNEELQTAKEELQSTNEELETVNEELQRGNAQLRETNDDLVNVLAGVDIAIVIVDVERRVRRFTPKARAVIKLIPSDLGRPIADLQPTVVVSGLDDTIAGVIATLASHEAEVRHPDGTCYRMQIRPYRTADHRIDGAVIAFIDITALRAAHDYAAAIVETVPTPLVVVDDHLRVEAANRAFYTTFEATPVQVIGRRFHELGEWRDPTVHARLEQVAADGISLDDLEIDYRAGLDDRVVRLAACALPSTAHRRSILIAMADITDRRRLEQARQAAAQERDSFLDAVSHELRTPLSAILLWADALRTLDHDDPLRLRGIDMITESARSEAQLVDDLLDLALSRTAQLTVHVRSLDPSSIVQAAVESARLEAAEKHTVIETALASGLQVAADPQRLRQIASSLLGNAIKFTPPGGRVRVELARHDGGMELRIRDSGPGIAPEFAVRAFEPFSRADGSSTRAHGGLGIGLALVRHLVERQGGTIDVASPGEAGQGTTFTVRMPVLD